MSEPEKPETPLPPTEEQLSALDVRGSSVALSAGAGTGKTFVLAERFVRALEGEAGSPLGRVLALTFTQKAARELRQRIRKECRARLERADDPGRWRAVLRGLEAARISTFHSFCGEILRDHAIEAGVDPGFSVLDESIALSIRQNALDASFREALTRRDPDLIELAIDYGLGNVRQAVDDLLSRRASGDLDEWITREPRALGDRWVAAWENSVRPRLLTEFRETIQPCLDLIGRNTFEDPKVRARLGELGEAVGRLDLPGDPIPALDAIAGAARVVGLAKKLWPSPELYEAIRDQFEEVRKAVKKLRERLPWDESVSLQAASQGLMFARLAVRARQTYDQFKGQQGGIDNDDMLLIVRRILADEDSTARRELVGSIDLVLVDEFQDTDPVQAGILERLAGPSILEGRLFLVGDTKQSIYRFRGAQPGLFQEYRERFGSDGRRELTANFRSVPAILHFVNALFGSEFDGEASALRPGLGSPGGSDDPAVEFLWPPEPTGDAEPAAGASEIPARRLEARRIARHLKRRLDAGWSIIDRKKRTIRPAHPGDVALLFRSMADASEYEQALVNEGLDYHVVGGSGFFAQQEVLDLINVLTAVEDPLDGVSLAGALRSPFFSISDDALFWIATEQIGRPQVGLDRCVGSWLDRLPEADRPRAERARRLLADWRATKDRLPIAGLVDRILADSGYEASLVGEFLGDRKRANARKLVEMARKFDEAGNFTLADFVARLRADLKAATRETQAATTDEEGEIVRLMTIHQAKGLEFPIVVLPDLDRKSPNSTGRVAFDPDLGPLVNPVVDPVSGDDEDDPGGSLGWTVHRQRERWAEDEEALRVFYVAVTRARDSLVISSSSPTTRRPTSPAMRLLVRRFDRSTGRFLGQRPDHWPEPRVRVVTMEAERGTAPSSSRRRRPDLPVAARMIEEGLRRPVAVEPPKVRRPRVFDLDPAFGLSSTSSRLDRLIRTILADPGALDSRRLEAIARHSARLQDPVATRDLVDRAIERLSDWIQTPEARAIAASTEIHRSFDWVIPWPEGRETTLFRGRGDFLYRTEGGKLGLIGLSSAEASEIREPLRLRLSAVAAERLGLGRVDRAWWIRLGSKDRPMVIDNFATEFIDQLLEPVFRSLEPSPGFLRLSGP